MHKSLGRKFAPDHRDLAHLLRDTATDLVRPPTRTWRLLWHGDQGETPHCVGYAWYGLLRSSPILNQQPLPDPLYFEAQKNDEFDGTDYDGTSVRGGAKALQKTYKELAKYGFAFTLGDALAWMAHDGPTVWGINWYEGMDNPDPVTGLVHVNGAVRGGHAVVCLGYNDQTERLIFQNSWGLGWGKHGRFQVGYHDGARLLAEDGEACSPTEVKL
jgi:Papain family cysteine protease